jgi:hypothetical protein
MNSLIYRYPTHLSISHSFLDKYIIGLSQGVLCRGGLNGPTAGITVGTVGRVGQCIKWRPIYSPAYSHSSISPMPIPDSLDPTQFPNILIPDSLHTIHLNGYIKRSSQWLYQEVISMVISRGHLNGYIKRSSQWLYQQVISMVISTGHLNGYINRSSQWLYQEVISMVISTGHLNQIESGIP